MAKPYIHAQSSARKYGGKVEDYLDIHNLLDSSKAAFGDNRHRALTHNAWFIGYILEKIFGVTRVNSDGKMYSVRDIGEQHVLEDFGGKFIPTAQDYLQEIEMQDWMNNASNGDSPPSYRKIAAKEEAGETKFIPFTPQDGIKLPQRQNPSRQSKGPAYFD